jgi:paraquat-inducible protein B
MSAGAPVQFEGIRVGRVLGAEWDDRARAVRVHVFVVRRFENQVRESTRFYRSGGLGISLAGGKLSMGESSISSILTGGLAFYTPDVLAGSPAKEGTQFELYESQAEAIAASDGPHLTYLTYFPGAVGGLSAGTRVEMRGIEVGRVRDVRLRYIEQNATLQTPVTIEIDPRKLEIVVPPTRADLRAKMNAALDSLIRKGMRAQLSTSLILPGAGAVSLDIVARPNTARLITTQDPPIIPAAGAGPGLDATLASVNRIAARLERVPIEQIAGDLRAAATRINRLVQDPALDQSISRLNSSLAEIERASKTVGANVDPIVQSLRNAASSAETAAGRARELMGEGPQQNYDLGELVKELTRAAESVRALANYLTENPDALLKGRPE